MFSKTKTLKSTNDYWQLIKRLKDTINDTDSILIGAGAGLSASAGLEYGGKRFMEHFSDYAEKYGLKDMYSAGFYPYETPEEYWAYWSRHIYLNRYRPEAGAPYVNLSKLMRGKDCFVITTNVDHCFQKAGFDKQRLFYTQGDYGLWQCSKPCRQETYDNRERVLDMVKQQHDMRIPTALIPRCPRCGLPMIMNLRINSSFAEDQDWHMASSRYTDFLNRCKDGHILYLELGVGFNTPSIIKYPFWQMTCQNPRAVYGLINQQESQYPAQLEGQTLCLQEDIGKVLKDLMSSNIRPDDL